MSDGNGRDRSVEALHEVVLELSGLREDTNARFRELGARIEEGFTRVDARFERMDERFERMDGRLGRVENVLLDTRQELRGVNERLENLRDVAGDRYRALEERVAKLEARMPE